MMNTNANLPPGCTVAQVSRAGTAEPAQYRSYIVSFTAYICLCLCLRDDADPREMRLAADEALARRLEGKGLGLDNMDVKAVEIER